jgi:hypothetical protein
MGADLVAVTGDIVIAKASSLGRACAGPAALEDRRVRDSGITTLYEPELIRRRLRRLGIRVLGNTWEQIEVRGLPLVVIGQETSGTRRSRI